MGKDNYKHIDIADLCKWKRPGAVDAEIKVIPRVISSIKPLYLWTGENEYEGLVDVMCAEVEDKTGKIGCWFLTYGGNLKEDEHKSWGSYSSSSMLDVEIALKKAMLESRPINLRGTYLTEVTKGNRSSIQKQSKFIEDMKYAGFVPCKLNVTEMDDVFYNCPWGSAIGTPA